MMPEEQCVICNNYLFTCSYTIVERSTGQSVSDEEGALLASEDGRKMPAGAENRMQPRRSDGRRLSMPD